MGLPLFELSETDNELDKILFDLNQPDEAFEAARRVQSMRDTVRSVGMNPDEATPRSNLFWDILDTIDAPRQGVAGVIDAALRGDIFSEGVGTGWRRGQTENISSSDIIRRQGWIENPIARGVVGFAADMVTDPLSWLSFGTAGVAKAGGKALTKAGLGLKDDIARTLVERGLDVVQESNALDDIFKAGDMLQRSSRRVSTTGSDAVRSLATQEMEKAGRVLERYGIAPEKFTLAGEDVFEKTAFNIGRELPFLGHVAGSSSDYRKIQLMADAGPVGQALSLFSDITANVLKPGKVKVASLDVSDDLLNAWDNVRLFANHSMEKARTYAAALEEVPVVGSVMAAGERGMKFLAEANKSLVRIFNQKALTGAAANENRLDFLNYREAARTIANDETISVLGDALQNPDLQRHVLLTIDGFAMDAIKSGTLADESLALAQINRLRDLQELPEDAAQLFKTALPPEMDVAFRQKYMEFMQSPASQELKDGVTRVMGHMDKLSKEEALDGLQNGFLEYYVPHRYLNLNRKKGGKVGTDLAWKEKRTYSTLTEAFEEGALIADTDLASIIQSRTFSSLNLRAQRNYWRRLAFEEGLDPQAVQALYREAFENPKGEAAALLSRKGINLDRLTAARNMAAFEKGKLIPQEQKALKEMIAGDPAANAKLAELSAEFGAKVHFEQWLSGSKPLDAKLPMEYLGELGEKVKIPGGKEEVFLPKEIARAFRETTAAKDMVKEWFGGSEIGKAMLGVLDYGTNLFKRVNTLPWPAYWGQNLIGDRYRQLTAGAAAMDPGIHARTWNVLSGKGAIKTRSGQIIDKPTLQRVMKQFGIQYTSNDMLEMVRSFGQADVERMLAKKNRLTANLMSGKVGVALEQAQDRLTRGFDGFFRVSHVIHRLEQGDTIADAVRGTNELYFNYRDLSPVESSLFRRFYMFYGYMSKATKATLNDLFTNPGNITAQIRGTKAFSEFFSDPKAAPTADEVDLKLLASATQSEQLSHPIGKTPEGKVIFGRGFAAPLNAVMGAFSLQSPRNLTIGEVTGALADSAVRTAQKQFAAANPWINAAAQRISGKNLYFDRPLDAEFLRKLPSITEIGKRLSQFSHTDIPADITEWVGDTKVTKWVMDFLDAEPDGKGRYVVNPAKHWALTNLIPGMGRFVSTVGNFANTDIPTSAALTRFLAGVNIEDGDISRTFLASHRAELERMMRAHNVSRRAKRLGEGVIEE